MSGKPRHLRLTRAQRDAMLSAYLAGVKIAALAAEFGVSESYPGHYARRFGYPARKPFRRYMPALPLPRLGLGYAPQAIF